MLIVQWLYLMLHVLILNYIIARHSFENVEKWYKEVKSARGNEALIVVFGNKIDC